jgi:purine nucleosidase
MNSEDIMASDGLGGASTEFTQTARSAESEPAAAALVRLAKENELQQDFTLIALGPLTNLALAVRLDPGFAARVSHLFVMGGAVHGQGNTSAAAEFNIYADPEAAQIVFSAGFKDIALLPWETCLKNPLLWEDYSRLVALPTPKAQMFGTITRSLAALMKDQFHTPGYYLPDLHAAAAAVDASIITQEKPGILEVDTASGSGRGLTSVRWQFDQGSSANVRVLEDIDIDKILKHLTAALIS